jgi:hypothetical protein
VTCETKSITARPSARVVPPQFVEPDIFFEAFGRGMTAELLQPRDAHPGGDAAAVPSRRRVKTRRPSIGTSEKVRVCLHRGIKSLNQAEPSPGSNAEMARSRPLVAGDQRRR